MLTLYYSKASSSLAAHILLEEVGADYDLVEVSLAEDAQYAAAFAALNPKMRVPALATPDGVISENPAILNYVASTHPEAGMWPASAFLRAQADALNAYLCATMHVAYAHKRRAARWADTETALQDMGAKMPANLAECAALIENNFLTGPWAFGDTYTTADAYLALVPNWLSKADVDIAPYPKLIAHGEASRARPATRRVLEFHGLA